eukprot:TRINITY_DN19541_c0_g1_i2.p1 TRINITY_DN19541_c0_g1~~TRINITY_DN19541_c0_g1_i2.p1  ORF type:complete len:523 (-),score=44.29 TRINITY_DN19541_c0_g1_i2:48-1616(-)
MCIRDRSTGEFVSCVMKFWRTGTLAAAAIFMLCLLAITPILRQRSSECPEAPTLLIPSQNTGAANSATGKIFQGLKARDFVGQRRFAGVPSLIPTRIKTSGRSCNKWSVVTTIFEPSSAVKVAAKRADWCIVIVADTKTPTNYLESAGLDKLAGVVFLTVARQREIMDAGDAFVSAVPWGHFSRKNIGYLYAIRHGAEFIFDFDDDNELQAHASSPLPGDQIQLADMRVVNVKSGDFVNPYPQMGPSQPDPWPRGLPLELIKSVDTRGVVSNSSASISLDRVAIVQSLADHDPDVDAIYRLTRKLPLTFQAAPAIKGLIVPPGLYTPYNAQATIHTKQAFWATLLPSTVPGRVSDIWRSYFAERLFADLNLSVAFVPPRVTQVRNAHNYLGDLNAEEDLYYKTSKLVQFLKTWQDSSTTLPERMENLWIALYERTYIEEGDVHLLQLWLQALIDCDYIFPAFDGTAKGATPVATSSWTAAQGSALAAHPAAIPQPPSSPLSSSYGAASPLGANSSAHNVGIH